jgi:Fe-S cluster assembly protein SufB
MEANEAIERHVGSEYKFGFTTPVENDSVAPGLNEETIRLLSTKKGEPDFMLEWRLRAYRHWLTMSEPTWAHVHYPPIDYQKIIYYSAPKSKTDAPKRWSEVDPVLLEMYAKLGVPAEGTGTLGRGRHGRHCGQRIHCGHVPEESGEPGHHLLLVFRSGQKSS